MAELRRTDDQSSPEMSPAHAELCGQIARVASELEIHIHPELSKLMTGMFGPVVDEVLDIRDYEQGMVYKMNHLLDKSNNGGWVATLAVEDRNLILNSQREQRTKIIVAVISAGAVIGAALIGTVIAISNLVP